MSGDVIRGRLVNAQQGNALLNEAYRTLKPFLLDGRVYELTIRPETRRSGQNALFHKLIDVIAKQDRLHGQVLDSESWKRLLIDAFKHETKDDPALRDEWAKFGELRLLPALNHAGFVAVGEQSRMFTVRLASAFVEWLYAFGAERGVRFPAFEREGQAA